jgi:hypothetical protein
MKPPVLQVTFNASGAALAGSVGLVVAVVDVVDSSTSAEAAVAAGALEVLGAAPAGASPPVKVVPAAIGRRAASIAARAGTDVVVVGEPRIGTEEERRQRCLPVLQALRTASVKYELVPNQGAELPRLIDLDGRVVVVVSRTGGAAFDAALSAGAPGVCFATSARIEGRTGWDVLRDGARRAIKLARNNETGIAAAAATANSADDLTASFELARAIVAEGFLRL